MTTAAGLVAAVVALGCAGGFVAAVVRADAAFEEEPVTSGFTGPAARWGTAAGVAVLLAVVLLVDAVVTAR